MGPPGVGQAPGPPCQAFHDIIHATNQPGIIRSGNCLSSPQVSGLLKSIEVYWSLVSVHLKFTVYWSLKSIEAYWVYHGFPSCELKGLSHWSHREGHFAYPVQAICELGWISTYFYFLLVVAKGPGSHSSKVVPRAKLTHRCETFTTSRSCSKQETMVFPHLFLCVLYRIVPPTHKLWLLVSKPHENQFVHHQPSTIEFNHF